MNQSIQHKIAHFKEMAKSQKGKSTVHSKSDRSYDGLAKVIRNEEDAAIFMAELRTAIEHSK